MFLTQTQQWCRVTNTIWWQDFSHLDVLDYLSLFTPIFAAGNNGYLVFDFAAQLAGFMALLVADVPSQAHWILELTKYDFKASVGYLVASVLGVCSSCIPCISKPKHSLGDFIAIYQLVCKCIKEGVIFMPYPLGNKFVELLEFLPTIVLALLVLLS